MDMWIENVRLRNTYLSMHFYVFNMLNYFYLAIQLNQGNFKTDDLLHLRGKLKLNSLG